MPASNEFQKALRTGNLPEAFVMAMGKATELNISTKVIKADGSTAEEPNPAECLETRVDILNGTIENRVGEEFVGTGKYRELQQFHQQQVALGNRKIQENFQSLQEMFRLLVTLQQYNRLNNSEQPLDLTFLEVPPKKALPSEKVVPSLQEQASMLDSQPSTAAPTPNTPPLEELPVTPESDLPPAPLVPEPLVTNDRASESEEHHLGRTGTIAAGVAATAGVSASILRPDADVEPKSEPQVNPQAKTDVKAKTKEEPLDFLDSFSALDLDPDPEPMMPVSDVEIDDWEAPAQISPAQRLSQAATDTYVPTLADFDHDDSLDDLLEDNTDDLFEDEPTIIGTAPAIAPEPTPSLSVDENEDEDVNTKANPTSTDELITNELVAVEGVELNALLETEDTETIDRAIASEATIEEVPTVTTDDITSAAPDESAHNFDEFAAIPEGDVDEPALNELIHESASSDGELTAISAGAKTTFPDGTDHDLDELLVVDNPFNPIPLEASAASEIPVVDSNPASPSELEPEPEPIAPPIITPTPNTILPEALEAETPTSTAIDSDVPVADLLAASAAVTPELTDQVLAETFAENQASELPVSELLEEEPSTDTLVTPEPVIPEPTLSAEIPELSPPQALNDQAINDQDLMNFIGEDWQLHPDVAEIASLEDAIASQQDETQQDKLTDGIQPLSKEELATLKEVDDTDWLASTLDNDWQPLNLSDVDTSGLEQLDLDLELDDAQVSDSQAISSMTATNTPIENTVDNDWETIDLDSAGTDLNDLGTASAGTLADLPLDLNLEMDEFALADDAVIAMSDPAMSDPVAAIAPDLDLPPSTTVPETIDSETIAPETTVPDNTVLETAPEITPDLELLSTPVTESRPEAAPTPFRNLAPTPLLKNLAPMPELMDGVTEENGAIANQDQERPMPAAMAEVKLEPADLPGDVDVTTLENLGDLDLAVDELPQDLSDLEVVTTDSFGLAATEIPDDLGMPTLNEDILTSLGETDLGEFGLDTDPNPDLNITLAENSLGAIATDSNLDLALDNGDDASPEADTFNPLTSSDLTAAELALLSTDEPLNMEADDLELDLSMGSLGNLESPDPFTMTDTPLDGLDPEAANLLDTSTDGFSRGNTGAIDSFADLNLDDLDLDLDEDISLDTVEPLPTLIDAVSLGTTNSLAALAVEDVVEENESVVSGLDNSGLDNADLDEIDLSDLGVLPVATAKSSLNNFENIDIAEIELDLDNPEFSDLDLDLDLEEPSAISDNPGAVDAAIAAMEAVDNQPIPNSESSLGSESEFLSKEVFESLAALDQSSLNLQSSDPEAEGLFDALEASTAESENPFENFGDDFDDIALSDLAAVPLDLEEPDLSDEGTVALDSLALPDLTADALLDGTDPHLSDSNFTDLATDSPANWDELEVELPLDLDLDLEGAEHLSPSMPEAPEGIPPTTASESTNWDDLNLDLNLDLGLDLDETNLDFTLGEGERSENALDLDFNLDDLTLHAAPETTSTADEQNSGWQELAASLPNDHQNNETTNDISWDAFDLESLDDLEAPLENITASAPVPAASPQQEDWAIADLSGLDNLNEDDLNNLGDIDLGSLDLDNGDENIFDFLGDDGDDAANSFFDLSS